MCGRGESGVWDPGVKQTVVGRCRAAPGAQLGAQRHPRRMGGWACGGGRPERAGIPVHVADSLCYIAEMNIVKQLNSD